MVKKTLGDILVAIGALTQEALADATKKAAESNVSLEKYLRDNNTISEQNLAKAYAEYAGLPLIDTITEKMADLDLLGKIPLKFLRDNVVMPVKIDDKVHILTANPRDFEPLDNINMLLGGGAQYTVAPKAAIVEAINRYYPIGGARDMIEELEEEGEKELDAVAFENIEEKDILAMASEAPIIKLVNHILYQAVKRGASDIHIEPFEKEVRVRYRIDGVMHEVMSPPKRLQGALISRIKIMAQLNIAEKRLPQDGRIQIKVADRAIDIRVSILPVQYGERVVMRLLDKTRSFSELDKLGLGERDLKLVLENIERPNGIIYVTGPTGSGKTSTLYSILAKLNRPQVNIITVEDPVEYQMAGIAQVQVREKVGLTFAVALRAILRQDPDIVMIGETRDEETAQIAIQAALTGHLVLSTLHTNSAPATITRLTDMGIESYLIASSIVVVIAQRLVRRLCDNCKRPYKPSKELLERLGVSEEKAQSITFYEAVGCPECMESGYKGRLPIFEVMPMTEEVARLTMERADTNRITKAAIKEGMITLLQDGLRKIEEGLTTIDEVLAVATLELEPEPTPTPEQK